MTALRCSPCGTNWPDTDEYGACPQCEGPTSRMDSAEPIGTTEAARLAAHARFERFYNGPWQERKQREQQARLERDLAQLDEAVVNPFEPEPA